VKRLSLSGRLPSLGNMSLVYLPTHHRKSVARDATRDGHRSRFVAKYAEEAVYVTVSSYYC